MGHSIRKCCDCGRYSLRDKCPVCEGITTDPRPARLSPKDPYGKYRRISKWEGRTCKAQK
ncbi:nucleolar RNA-binding Nop10p family protein [Methanohalophilus levihalophilus]|uniref:nucleolar RNA-binding Nop10p family protein n=1 Tax=Methanohalophilus levihalophilus TaxID=1431282 RepID=UPI001AE68379|nr:nucleolar RNA-binding Nop10p family protein [Methanohalophilus levihalophilus]